MASEKSSMASTPASEVPAGYKLVPTEPTEAMIEAAKDERMACFKDTMLSVGDALTRIYKAALAATPASPATEGEAVRCSTCGGRDIPWDYGKCHCFKTTKDSNDCEHHGADAQSTPQVGGADAGADRGGAGSGANIGDEHRSAASACDRHSGYSLGDGVRLPDAAAIREAIELTPTPEPIDWSRQSPSFAAPIEAEAQKAVAWQYAWRDNPSVWFPVGNEDQLDSMKTSPNFVVRPLYAAPTSSASAEVVALTEAELTDALRSEPWHWAFGNLSFETVRWNVDAIQSAFAKKNGWRLGGTE